MLRSWVGVGAAVVAGVVAATAASLQVAAVRLNNLDILEMIEVQMLCRSDSTG